MRKAKSNARMLLGSLALMVTIWGVLGWFDLEDRTEAGFDLDNKHTVTYVDAEGPAAKAGLEVGDQVLEIAGYAVEDARSLAHLPRMNAGDMREFTVLRDGAEQTMAIVYRAISEHQVAAGRAVAVVGFCFLMFPLLALYRRSNDATRILAVMGTGLSLYFLPGPDMADASMGALMTTISLLFSWVGMAALLQFLLIFPHRRPFMEQAHARSVLYLPVVALWLGLAWRLLFTPTSSTALNTITSVSIAVVEMAYLLFALLAILRNYHETDLLQRRQGALTLMLWGTLLGVLPALLALLAKTFSPQSVLPGQDFYVLSLILIPLLWAYSSTRLNN